MKEKEFELLRSLDLWRDMRYLVLGEVHLLKVGQLEKLLGD